MRGILKWTGLAAAVRAVAVVIGIAFSDWNSLKGFVSARRRFAIRGDLGVDLSVTPPITAHRIHARQPAL
jgi:uncharacterized protein involved in outer membrane biogenesis